MTKPDYRALCARMADELDEYRQLLLDDRSVTHRLADEARAALAEPEPAGQIPPDYIDPQHTGPDRELLQAFYAACQSEGGTIDEVTLRGLRAAIAADRAQRQPVPPEPEGPTDEELFAVAEAYAEDNGLIGLHNAPDFARAALARWGRQVPMESKFNIKWALDALERLRDASMRYRLGVFSREELQLYEDRAQKVIEAWSRGDEHEMSGSDATPQPVRVPVGERLPGPPYREVADLVVWLEDHSAECLELDRPEWSKFIAKAAKFLHLYLKAAHALPTPSENV